jgi:hypothetical protein
LIPVPKTLSFEEAAAVPLQGMTAHYLINDYRKPTKGDVVLIHAAAGGVADGSDVELLFPVAEDVGFDAKFGADLGHKVVLSAFHFHISWRGLRRRSRAMLSRGEIPSCSIL